MCVCVVMNKAFRSHCCVAMHVCACVCMYDAYAHGDRCEVMQVSMLCV